VNNIFPGLTETPRMQKLLAGKAAARGWSEKDIYREYVQEMSLGRISQPQDIANAAFTLASDESRNITGQDLIVDGGWKL
jgi:NAD(P)-dependent dehydrogenase (short-subunit alcohol dehydrogenase family)